MKKSLTKSVFLLCVLFCWLIQPFFSVVDAADVSADAPDVCHWPTPAMQLYFDFQAEMAQTLLGGVLGEKLFNVTVNPLGLFTSKVLDLHPETKNAVVDVILTTLYNNVLRVLQSSTTTAVLVWLSALSVIGSNLDGLRLLFEDRPMVRDYKTLLEIETKLMQISYYLWKQTRIMANLENPEKLYTVVKKYQDLGLFTGVQETHNVSYLGILSALIRMNASMKKFVTWGGSYVLKWDFNALFNAGFDPEWIQQIDDDYSFLWGGLSTLGLYQSCNNFRKQTLRDLGKISQIWTAVTKSWQTISSATKRLMYAILWGKRWELGWDTLWPLGFLGGNVYFTDVELQQLRTVYGIDTTQMTTRELGGLRSLITPLWGWKKARNDTKKRVSSVVETSSSGISEFIAGVEDWWNFLREMNNDVKWADVLFSQLSPEERRQYLQQFGIEYSKDFKDGLQQQLIVSVNDADELARQTKEMSIAVDTSVQTPLFHAIVDQIHQLDELIKDRQSGMCQKLVEICKYQASNKWNDACNVKC